MVGLDQVVLEDAQVLLGHHDKWSCPKQLIMEPRPQRQFEMARIRHDKGDALRDRSNGADLASSDIGQLVNTDRMPPYWNGTRRRWGI